MKKVFILLFLSFSLVACDDGNLIVTDFDFNSDSDLQFCYNGSGTVLFVINSDPDEAIAITLPDENFDGTFEEDEEQQIIKMPITEASPVVYRSFTDRVNKEYYCSGIPSTEPEITNEYRSKNGGNLYLTTTVTKVETDSLSRITTKTFETYAEIQDITLKNTKKDEEIVRESLKIGSFRKEKIFNE